MIEPRLVWLAIGSTCGSVLTHLFYEWQWFGLHRPRRRGSNPPAPGCKPAPPAGPPARPATFGWQPNQQEIDKLATQLEEDGKYLIAAGYANECVKTRDLGIRVIRAATLLAGGWGSSDVPLPPEMDPRFGVPWDLEPYDSGALWYGGQTTSKPPIKPRPSGGRILRPWE